jgi:hypothetical protein
VSSEVWSTGVVCYSVVVLLVESGGLLVMWWNGGVVRWLSMYMSRFMYQRESGWVGFVGVWGGILSGT